jgi:hypothetical protein
MSSLEVCGWDSMFWVFIALLSFHLVILSLFKHVDEDVLV